LPRFFPVLLRRGGLTRFVPVRRVGMTFFSGWLFLRSRTGLRAAAAGLILRRISFAWFVGRVSRPGLVRAGFALVCRFAAPFLAGIGLLRFLVFRLLVL